MNTFKSLLILSASVLCIFTFSDNFVKAGSAKHTVTKYTKADYHPTMLKNPFLAYHAQDKHRSDNKTAAPVPAPTQLKGIIQNKNNNAAIIEYLGKSNFYVTGQSFGSYKITAITSDTVTYADSNNTYTLYMKGR